MTDGKTVATDSQGTVGTERQPGEFVKVVGDEHSLFCFSGAFAMFDPLVKWYREGCLANATPRADPDYSYCLWVFDVDLPHPLRFVNVHQSPYPSPLFTPCAMGSGGDYALGAVYAGATLEQAVNIAAKLDVYTGGPVKLYDIPDTPRPKPPVTLWEKIKNAVGRYKS